MIVTYERMAPRLRLCMLVGLVFLPLFPLGCATLVSTYDQESVNRVNEISKAVLELYQDLLSTAPDQRGPAIAGPLRQRQGDVESQLRLHLLREEGRAPNGEGTTIARNLLESWQTFSASHLSGSETALTNATLIVERQILERHLRSAFVVEESKRIPGRSTK